MLAASCKKDVIWGKGSVETETREISSFTKVSVKGSTDVHITHSDNFNVKVKGYHNIIPYLRTYVENGTLEIKFESDKAIHKNNAEVYISMPVLEGLKTSGSGNIDVKGNFENVEHFDASISGSSNISIEKALAENLKLSISGSGDFKSFGLEAEEADVNLSGSGRAELTVHERLNVKISGSGDVYYKGEPGDVQVKISGSGKLRKK